MLRFLVVPLMVKLVFSQGVGLKEAGIRKNPDSSYALKFHSKPDAYLGWKIHEDNTLWLTLNCHEIKANKYCAIGITKPGLKDEEMTNMFNSDIYTAYEENVDDRYGDSISDKPTKDKHQDIICNHCGIHDNGELHATFYRNFSTGDPKDVPITNRTYRLIWAIGPLDKNNDITYHIFKPMKDYEYKYINFLVPELTEVPEFHDRVKKRPSKKSAAAAQMSLVSLLLFCGALVVLVTAAGGATVDLAAAGLLW